MCQSTGCKRRLKSAADAMKHYYDPNVLRLGGSRRIEIIRSEFISRVSSRLTSKNYNHRLSFLFYPIKSD